jgi:hypothetical protein
MTAVALELLPVQYGDATGTITTEERDATTATYFTPDSDVYLALKRSPTRKWMFDFSDYIAGDGPIWRHRWPTPAAALEWLAARDKRTVTQVQP